MSDIVERLRSTQNPGLAVRQQAADEIKSLRSRLADLEAERALIIQRAENAEAALAYAASTGDECAIEVEALRKDAERYRWLRDKKHPSLGLTRLVLNDTPHGIDAAIDAAMGESHE